MDQLSIHPTSQLPRLGSAVGVRIKELGRESSKEDFNILSKQNHSAGEGIR